MSKYDAAVGHSAGRAHAVMLRARKWDTCIVSVASQGMEKWVMLMGLKGKKTTTNESASDGLQSPKQYFYFIFGFLHKCHLIILIVSLMVS